MEKLIMFGYVYMWCDLERDMYYIGSHTGKTQSIKYKTGNGRMSNILHNRPETCKKVILEYYYGQCRMELYNLEQKWLNFYDVEKNKYFYNHSNLARGPIRNKSSKKGKTMSEMKPGWVNPNKGKTRQEIMGRDVDVSCCKPFILTIQEPYKDQYTMYYKTIRECVSHLKLYNIVQLSIYGKIQIKKIFKTTKHNFPKNTIITLDYVDERGNIITRQDEELLSVRKQRWESKIQKHLTIQKLKGGKIPPGKKPKKYTITVYEPDKERYDIKVHSDIFLINNYGLSSLWIYQLKARKIKSITTRTHRTRHPFPIGTVMTISGFDDNVKDTRSPKDIYLPFLIDVIYPTNIVQKIICYTLDDFESKFQMTKSIANIVKKTGTYKVKNISYSKTVLPKDTILKYTPLTEQDIISLHEEKFKIN